MAEWIGVALPKLQCDFVE